MLPPTQYTRTALIKLAEWERSFYAVQSDAIKWVPKALAELDARLVKVLAEVVQAEIGIWSGRGEGAGAYIGSATSAGSARSAGAYVQRCRRSRAVSG